MYETITIETDRRGVARLTLNRPEKHNAMNAQMIAELTQAARDMAADDAIRVVVLTGEGPSFCAGGDLAWMRAQMEADRSTREAAAHSLALMLGMFNTLPKPLIGRVQGNAFGGGVGLCCVCDIVYAADTAKFGLTETKLGLIPATIGPFVTKRMGEGAARQMMMSSRVVAADRAQALGIVSQTAPLADLDRAVSGEVAAYLDCAPSAVAAAKQLTLQLAQAPTETDVDVSVAALIRAWESPDAEAGIAAFLNKTAPPWAG